MKIPVIIDKVSELYRDASLKTAEINHKMMEVEKQIIEADYNRGENITVADYNRLKEQAKTLHWEMHLQQSFRNGISEVREMLFNLQSEMEEE